MKFYFGTINFVVLRINRVQYYDFPKINGKLIVINRGVFKMGSKNKFNSTLYSNLVGIYKPCSVEVQKGAVLQIGDFSGFSGVSIYCANKITIGNYLCCGGNVSIDSSG